jgi:hypothetical protein
VVICHVMIPHRVSSVFGRPCRDDMTVEIRQMGIHLRLQRMDHEVLSRSGNIFRLFALPIFVFSPIKTVLVAFFRMLSS